MRAMKDSGVDWIGEIPKEWNLIKFKYVHNGSNVGVAIDKKFWTNNDADKIFYTAQILPIRTNYTNFPSCKYTKGHDLLLARNATPYVYLPVEGAIYTDHIIRVTISNRFNRRFIRYCLQNSIITEVLEGVSIPTWSVYIWDRQILPLPPLAEQTAIASYLDKKCSNIDAIITKNEQIIEKLKEYKSSLITETVTKGLNPDVEMKDSGVEWIGEIPTGWSLSRIKNEFDNLDYKREPISAEKRENKLGLYDYYGASGVIDKIDNYNVDEKVLLIGEDGANLRMRNLPLIYKASGKIWVNNHAHILRVHDINDYGFMAYLLEAGDYNRYITGSAQPKFSQENLMRFPICVPPLSEQIAIAAYLDKKCSIIDSNIAKRELINAKLAEYKKSLIYEVVTGKKEV